MSEQREKRGPGRPASPESRYGRVTVRVHPAELERLREAAARHGEEVATYVRRVALAEAERSR